MSICKKVVVLSLFYLSLFSKDIDYTSKLDALIINGIYAKEVGDSRGALHFFKEAYTLHPSSVIAYESAAILIKERKYFEAIMELEESIKHFGATKESDKLLISAYLHLNDLVNATKVANDLLKKERSVATLNLVASVYFAKKDYLKSSDLFKEAYDIDKNEGSLLKYTDILYYFLGEKEKAKRVLKEAKKEFGCSYEVCKKLISYEQEEKNFAPLPELYMELFEMYKVNNFAIAAAELYIMNGQNNKAIEVLTKTGADSSLLLSIYKFEGRYKEALEIANSIYSEQKTPQNLAQVAMLEYEVASDKNSSSMLKSVTEKLRKVTYEISDDVIDNFYGYLLIDHDIDYEEGIFFVKRALKKKPNSPYYLDSLAWGYYKLGECKKALEPMERAYKELEKEEEIVSHMEAIQRCIKDKR